MPYVEDNIAMSCVAVLGRVAAENDWTWLVASDPEAFRQLVAEVCHEPWTCRDRRPLSISSVTVAYVADMLGMNRRRLTRIVGAPTSARLAWLIAYAVTVFSDEIPEPVSGSLKIRQTAVALEVMSIAMRRIPT